MSSNFFSLAERLAPAGASVCEMPESHWHDPPKLEQPEELVQLKKLKEPPEPPLNLEAVVEEPLSV